MGFSLGSIGSAVSSIAGGTVGKTIGDFGMNLIGLGGGNEKNEEKYYSALNDIYEQQLAESKYYFDQYKTYFAPVDEGIAKIQLENLPNISEATQNFYALSKPQDATLNAGQAMTDVNRNAGISQDTMNRNLARQGVNPGSLATQSSLRNTALQNTALRTGAANQARQQTGDINLRNAAMGSL
jgi:hypothetical protein